MEKADIETILRKNLSRKAKVARIRRVESNNHDFLVWLSSPKKMQVFLKKFRRPSFFDNEFFFYNLFRCLKIPTPDVIFYDRSSYTLCLKIVDGNIGYPFVLGLSRKKRKELFTNFGRFVSNLHSFNFSEFHIVGEFKVTPFNDVLKRFKNFEKYFVLARLVDEYKKLKEMLFSFREDFKSIKSFKICHNDLNLGNVFFDDDLKVIAICDFEIAKIGDVREDLARLEFFNSMFKEFRSFWKGYGEVKRDEKFYLYRLLINLSFLVKVQNKLNVEKVLNYILSEYKNNNSLELRRVIEDVNTTEVG